MTLIHEQFGLLYEQHGTLLNGHTATIAMLTDLKAGKIKLDDVEIDENGQGWKIKEKKNEPTGTYTTPRQPISWPCKV